MSTYALAMGCPPPSRMVPETFAPCTRVADRGITAPGAIVTYVASSLVDFPSYHCVMKSVSDASNCTLYTPGTMSD